MSKYIAAIDQGTTSTRFMVFDHGGNVVARQVHVDRLARRYLFRRFAAELFGIEVEDLTIQHFDGAFIAHELLAIAKPVVAEIARIVDVEAVRVFIQSAQRIRHFAIVTDPTINSSGRGA